MKLFIRNVIGLTEALMHVWVIVVFALPGTVIGYLWHWLVCGFEIGNHFGGKQFDWHDKRIKALAEKHQTLRKEER